MRRAKLNAILVVMLLAGPVAVFAQSSLDPGQLPESTTFYLAWHGTPSIDARKANSLLATWDDADFGSVRAAIIEALMSSSADSAKAKAALTREELSQYASLLDNEIVFGYIVNPNQVKSSEAGHESQKNPWNGMFLVYDHTGKEATLARLLLQVRMNEKDPAKISAATIAGISAIKTERKDGATFWADDGKYTLVASEPAVFEKISAWTKHATPEAATLAQTAAYREAGGLLKGGPMDFLETQAATRLGMPLPDAIGLFSGEFATLQSSSTLDSAKQVYVVGIREKVATLKLLRAGLAERVTAERSEVDTTLLRM